MPHPRSRRRWFRRTPSAPSKALFRRLNLPSLNLPPLNLPSLNLPPLNLPPLNLPPLNLPPLNLPPLNLPPLNLPPPLPWKTSRPSPRLWPPRSRRSA